MYLVGLHDDLVRRISLGIHPRKRWSVATCAVAVYHLYNTFYMKILSFMDVKEGV
jgi:hypothetical protein